MTASTARKRAVRRLFEGVINEDRPEVADELVAPGFINHDDAAGGGSALAGPATFTAGARTLTWDGRDEAGARLAPGAYVLRLEAGEIVQSRQVHVVR